jgi:hypothetical protein
MSTLLFGNNNPRIKTIQNGADAEVAESGSARACRVGCAMLRGGALDAG